MAEAGSPASLGTGGVQRNKVWPASAPSRVQGLEHSSVQDVPISKPFNQKGVDELLAMLDVVGLMDWYVNIHDHLPKIEALLQV